MPRVSWRYAGEELGLYWESPYGHGEEKIASFWWPAPSLLCNPDHPPSRCHSFVTDGRIQFLDDCHHALAGQTVDLPEWED